MVYQERLDLIIKLMCMSTRHSSLLSCMVVSLEGVRADAQGALGPIQEVP